jgi:drug/metabolite transporter (DMT)-like permease
MAKKPAQLSASVLIAMTAAAMTCFAANSLLCRAALRGGAIDPQTFSLIRILSGALLLALLALRQGGAKALKAGEWRGALALLGYIYFFSYSYLRLDAGIGALVLFGMVQVTMVGWSLLKQSRPAMGEWIGLGLALLGLAALTLPGKSAPDWVGAILMAVAGVCWGAYSLLAKGRKSPPLHTTAANFVYAAPVGFLVFAVEGGGASFDASAQGVLLAVLSGAITSGLGYSIWYAVAPKLGAMRSAVVQLSVPVIAMAAAALLLGEKYSARSIAAAAVTLCGVAIALFWGNKKRA